jgi:hypothetical protein
MRTIRKRARVLLLFAGTLVPVACGGSGGGGGTLPPEDVSGLYAVDAVEDGTDCGEGVTQDSWNLRITQTGADAVLSTPFGGFPGTVSGNEVTVSGTYPEDGGYTTFQGSGFSVDGDALVGLIVWTWSTSPTGVPVVCAGTTDITGIRLLEILSFDRDGQTDVPLDASLTFEFTHDVDPTSVHDGSVRIRYGPTFQLETVGAWQVNGSTLVFQPGPGGWEPATLYTVNFNISDPPNGVASTGGLYLGEEGTFFIFTTAPAGP